MELVRRVGAYGILWESGRVLVVRDGVEGEFPGVWRLPGGAVAHAEHPERAVVREVARQAGLIVTVGPLRAVLADVTTYPEDDVAQHTDRLLFELSARDGASGDGAQGDDAQGDGASGDGAQGDGASGDGALRHGASGDGVVGDGALGGGALGDGASGKGGGGSVDQAQWLTLPEVARLPLAPFSAEALGLPVTPLPSGTHRSYEPFPPPHPDRRLRFGAYGLVTDPAGRILLTQIAAGYPGAGQWHLPGGGTDHGEQPTVGLLRELVEEGGQLGRVVELLGVDNLHNPAALGPEGRPLDWHGVRVIYRMLVDVPTDAVVTESAGGSTARAGWFTRAQALDLPLSDIAALAIGQSG
ncbi:ADP-ribose pyrophosphatase YjhB (NUDIX family) [Micromonospora luteifusca]|uniref:ADP-ribose pyrophosphatase YjhB (NUDIX family) n=1 Tax=Micromonospora luteifusca TaxID=709860 RepID=A0ABS2LRL0_9ACTN|nr:NUDIX domain-containing protein [Micromonospora luteifusca]MBM7490828.1 ADP-ribose pyrophosphatase YjhB (NUDIX family) [Micromonospora luteifusca]